MRRAMNFRLAATLAVLLVPAAAQAGPCSNDIAELSRILAASPALGPATTGALSGSGPGSVKPATGSETGTKTGTSADQAMGGTGGTKEMNAAVGQVATSADDVRRQQEGLPTAAQVAAQGSANTVETAPSHKDSPKPDERISAAKMELEKARALDQRNDTACGESVKRVRQLMGS